ncbi:alpha/beta fold hydrolase [Nonomuraea angiospora]|uniref:alpha/beta fold hydrolase n=1 Tax=Nonomuraea angiospora TaxID=46172 RepID=UPI00299F94D8|nr:hypothetical protein [Nonomuraea angiospora]MDX3103506.1 hypothetical protein [Nonomuraea angiospora]
MNKLHRMGLAATAAAASLALLPGTAELEARLAKQPAIIVPAVTLDGLADGNFPATDGSPTVHHSTGPRLRRTVAGAGHNLPQERPAAFAAAVRDVRELRRENAGRERFVGRRQDTP